MPGSSLRLAPAWLLPWPMPRSSLCQASATGHDLKESFESSEALRLFWLEQGSQGLYKGSIWPESLIRPSRAL